MAIRLMNAVVCTAYGAPETLKLKRVKKPRPKDHEILVEIMATAVTSRDLCIREFNKKRGTQTLMRLLLGIKKPRNPILGMVFSGIVEDVGRHVTHLKSGDEVFASTGSKMSAYAQYISISKKGCIVRKPKYATFEESAAIISGGISALYFLKKARITAKTSPKVLIYGVTSSVGIAAVEIAKYYQATVTVVCDKKEISFAKGIGCDELIAHTSQDFTKLTSKFDIIFDAIGTITKRGCTKLLVNSGRFVTVGHVINAKETKKQLVLLKELYEKGFLNAYIDRVFPLEKIAEAHHYVGSGRNKASVILKVD